MKKYVAEFISTFALVLMGTGAIVVNDITQGEVTHVGVSLVFGLIVLANIYAVGDISGAHMNPAVTIGFFVARRLPGGEVAPYILSQVAGAVAASGFLRLLFPEQTNLGATLPSGPVLQSFLLEGAMTWFLMLVVLCVSTGAKEKGLMAGIAIGSVIALEALLGGPISGASMNPARSIGPALVSGQLTHLWVYLAGPVLGAVCATYCCRCIQPAGCCGATASAT